jgi:putative transposase
MQSLRSSPRPRSRPASCVLLRYSMQFASWKERKALASALKPIYQAATAEDAREKLETFSEGVWGRKYPMIVQSWKRTWEQVIPFFAFPAEVRRMIYTTNATESLHSQVRKGIRGRGHFPSDDAATKLIWLVSRNVQEKWKMPPIQWHAAKNQFAIHFENRFVISA